MKQTSFFRRFLLVAATLMFTIPVAKAQLLPSIFNNFFKDNIVDVAFNRIQMFFLILLGGFLILVVFYIIRGLQHFASKDNSNDMSEATNIMQRNMIAVGGVFVGVIGVAVVLIFFGINPGQVVPNEICINAADSYGCYACTEKPTHSSNKDKFATVCDVCNQDPETSFGNDVDPVSSEVIGCSTQISKGVTRDQIEDFIKGAAIE